MAVRRDVSDRHLAVSMTGLEQRLERGDIVSVHPCPFPLPADDDRAFLMRQRVNSTIHKNISFNPANQTVSGYAPQAPEEVERLRQLMRAFHEKACDWLAERLPRYACGWQADRASLRTEEEAIRKLRLTARNDLLHFDAFPSRPTHGQRILRLYVNINPTDDRVWMTSDTFAMVLEKYGRQLGWPGYSPVNFVRRLSKGLCGLFQANAFERTEYDDFMLRLHHFLKANDDFQERSLRRLWHFKPGTAWILFTDALSHAELRGQYALEHSFFVAPQTLVAPEESPLALLQRKSFANTMPRAA
jgi:hypothetical protein